MAYLVFHDTYDKGAMEIWPVASMAQALARAEAANERLDQEGMDDCGIFQAYEEIPHNKEIYKLHDTWLPPNIARVFPERRIK